MTESFKCFGEKPISTYTLTSLQLPSLQHIFIYNSDHCWILISHYRLFLLYVYIFYSRYKTIWIANTEIGLDPNNSVIKRLGCTLFHCYMFWNHFLLETVQIQAT